MLGLQDEDWAGDEANAAKAVARAWTDIIEDARSNNVKKGRMLMTRLLGEIPGTTLSDLLKEGMAV